jgi:hypothetical protein
MKMPIKVLVSKIEKEISFGYGPKVEDRKKWWDNTPVEHVRFTVIPVVEEYGVEPYLGWAHEQSSYWIQARHTDGKASKLFRPYLNAFQSFQYDIKQASALEGSSHERKRISPFSSKRAKDEVNEYLSKIEGAFLECIYDTDTGYFEWWTLKPFNGHRKFDALKDKEVPIEV